MKMQSNSNSVYFPSPIFDNTEDQFGVRHLIICLREMMSAA